VPFAHDDDPQSTDAEPSGTHSSTHSSTTIIAARIALCAVLADRPQTAPAEPRQKKKTQTPFHCTMEGVHVVGH